MEVSGYKFYRMYERIGIDYTTFNWTGGGYGVDTHKLQYLLCCVLKFYPQPPLSIIYPSYGQMLFVMNNPLSFSAI
jgi:hypothetical protein